MTASFEIYYNSDEQLSEKADWPLVSCLFPLYESRKYADNIAANIKAIRYPNVEIIISDRHCRDDTIPYLQDIFAGDNRVRFISTTDEAGYALNINSLILQSRGKYFRFMPHDDRIPECQLVKLVEILESEPDCVLVYGPIKRIYSDGRQYDMKLPKRGYRGKWTYETSAFLMYHGYHGASFKGLIRASTVRDNNILLPATDRIIIPDRCWAFALSLKGRFCIYDQFQYEKLIYPDSTYYSWLQRQKPVDLIHQFLCLWNEHRRLDSNSMRLAVFLIVGTTGTLRKILTLPQMPKVVRKATYAVKALVPSVLIKQFASKL